MSRYTPIPKTKSIDGKSMYTTTRYPNIPRSFNDTYVYTTIGDRLDTLAQKHYGDSNLWWIISTANSQLPQNSLTPPVGFQLRIPSNISQAINAYSSINSNNTTNNTLNPSEGDGY